MAKYQIVGIHPKLGVSRIYAMYAPENEIAEYLARAKAEGWTDLTRHSAPQPQLWPDEPEPSKQSASSDEPTSMKKNGDSSSSSDGLLRAGATRTYRSKQKGRKRQ